MSHTFTHNGLYPFRCLRRRTVAQELGLSYAKKKTENQLKKLKNLTKGFATKGISSATRRKISYAFRVLSKASVVRKVRNSKGQYVNHHLQFITLTLPSEQVHSDQFITKEVLGNFLDRSRKLGLFQNYVWRAEKQGNGNIHYHMITDTFCSFSMVRRIWYLALRKFGYLQNYSAKFGVLSLKEYSGLEFNKNLPQTLIASRFARGLRNNWSEPPCVDVAQIDNAGAVEKYISKYVSKDSGDSSLFVEGRSWACSSSVSLAGKVWKEDKEFSAYWYGVAAQILKRDIIEFDFFSMVKCKLSSFLAWYPEMVEHVRKLLHMYFTPCPYWRNSVGLYDEIP